MDNHNGDSSANTVLIIVVLVILVGLVIWWFGGLRAPAAPQNPGLNVDVRLPSGDTTPTTTTGGTQPAPQ